MHTRLILAGALLMAAGCASPPMTVRDQHEPGYIIMLPGVEGGAWQFNATVRGLRQAGIHRPVEAIAWGVRPFGSLTNLRDIAANRRRAQEIAAHITQLQAGHPDGPLTLVGFSGGGGLAILTVESLPEQVQLDRLILIGAAVSPDYDLSRCLARCRHGVVNFYSSEDWVVLGAGTRLFGTIDRKETVSAGYRGFRTREDRLVQREGLVQIPWRAEWRELGHWGGHIGWLTGDWAREVLARYIDPGPATRPAGDREGP